MGRSEKLSLLGIGHSHLIALRLAAMHRKQIGANNKSELSDIMLQKEEYQPILRQGWEGFIEPLASAIEKAILGHDAEIAGKKPDLVFSSIGGNEHFVFGLLQQEIPYDFVLKNEPKLPVIVTENTIAYETIKEILCRRMKGQLCALALLKEQCASLYHIESPPPIFDTKHILAHLDKEFRLKVEKRRKDSQLVHLDESVVAPPYLRYKLWRLQSEIFKEACEQMEISFIPAPANTMDENGFLKQQYWFNDATHGNVAYGEEVLQVLEKIAYAK